MSEAIISPVFEMIFYGFMTLVAVGVVAHAIYGWLIVLRGTRDDLQ